MAILSKEVVELLQDKQTVKVISTVSDTGELNASIKGSLMALEDGNLAYMELLETSQTQRNVLWAHLWNKSVSVLVYNPGNNQCYKIKGEPVKFLIMGPVWDIFLEETWKMLPEANPAGVWLIKPVEVVAADYFSRLEAEAKRLPHMPFWSRILGPRP